MTDQRRPSHQPLVRRDADGRASTADTWESLTERLIREAQEAGAFDDLPAHGQPLQLDEDRYAGDMALANHVLRNAGAAPPWIESDKAARRSLADIDMLLGEARRSPVSAHARLERRLMGLADAHDDAAARLEALAPTARQQRRKLDRTLLLRRLHDALSDGRHRP